MEITIKSNQWMNSVIMGVLLLVIGLLIIIFKAEALKWILIIAGVLLVIAGIITLYGGIKTGVHMDVAVGAIALVLGVVLILVPNFITDVMMILLAILLIVLGIMNLANAAPSFSLDNKEKVITAVIGVVMIILGVYAILNRDTTADIIMIVIGALMMISGALKVIDGYRLKM